MSVAGNLFGDCFGEEADLTLERSNLNWVDSKGCHRGYVTDIGPNTHLPKANRPFDHLVSAAWLPALVPGAIQQLRKINQLQWR